MTDLYHTFLRSLADAAADLQEARQALSTLPPSNERTVLLKCMGVLQQGIDNTWVYFETVVPAPVSLTDEPPITGDDTHPYIPTPIED